MAKKRYANLMPPELREIYESQDGDLNLRDEVSLIDTRITTLLMDLKTSRPDPELLYHAFSQLELAILAQEETNMLRAMNYMRALLHGGSSEKSVWEDIVRLVELRGKLVSSETDRSLRMDHMINADEVAMTVNRLLSAISLHVEDKTIIQKITATFKGLLNEKQITTAKPE